MTVCVTGRIPPPSKNCTNIGKVHGYKSRGGEGCGVSENVANTVKGGRASFKPKMNVSKCASPRSKKIIVRSKTVADIRNEFENFQKQSSCGERNKRK